VSEAAVEKGRLRTFDSASLDGDESSIARRSADKALGLLELRDEVVADLHALDRVGRVRAVEALAILPHQVNFEEETRQAPVSYYC
jgi:hypothetical protein